MNIPEFKESKRTGKKSSWVTCYDYSSALILKQSPIQGVLIGDSVAMTIYGHVNTLNATTEMIARHTSAVAKALEGTSIMIVADLPFLSVRKSLDYLLVDVTQLMQAGAHAVKIEGLRGNESKIQYLVESGIPVMGHLGLTPQFINQFGGFKVQGKSEQQAEAILNDALEMQKQGCFALVLECIPSSLASLIQSQLSIPVIGIGAGSSTDGQILVWQDLLGYPSPHKPKFVRYFANHQKEALHALTQYHNEVLQQSFPSPLETYS